ncbi:hypothetical protein [Rhodococcus daqingensis]|uniref:Uncharacterized protein n=1 Tax=Rhodococcus daqingensis TaxID=2479363 RepID=A0ABW2S0C2_9NOCA
MSRRDPGVHNWLDPEGHEAGMLAIRWQHLSGTPAVDRALRGASVVKLDALKQSLPAGTAFVNPAERLIQQQLRAVAYDRRLTG